MALRRVLLSLLPVGLVVFALSLVACGGPPDATDGSATASGTVSTPTPDPRPTPASSKGPARNLPKPVLPEAAKQNTEEGFAAFTQYWFDTVTYARETGDIGPLSESSQPSCKMCQFQIDKAKELHQDGGWSVGPRRTVSSFQANMAIDAVGNVMALFSLDESASTRFDRDGSAVKSYEGGTAEGAQVIYARFDSAWTTVEAGRA
ncbi:DUF6318 family protein [Sinomonas sp. ASV322]|uniref:DUF6318 family protein n=1 Tax=Sinomonas sp. ASV322 TaxID=3041920 RepID=UPI0027DCB383|nr:DUF6318 family protein [Sinomonas sp. ASV322]MDQ4502691.1 DUF6318 family protein [Sinomonas sp. ASV322]